MLERSVGPEPLLDHELDLAPLMLLKRCEPPQAYACDALKSCVAYRKACHRRGERPADSTFMV